MAKMSKCHIEALEIFNTYFHEKIYEFNYNDNLLKLELDEQQFASFIGYKKLNDSKKRSISFCGIVKVLNDENFAIKIRNNRLAILNSDNENLYMIAIFDIDDDYMKFIDIDYNIKKGGKHLEKNEYISILKRVKHAKKITLENAIIKDSKQKIRSI